MSLALGVGMAVPALAQGISTAQSRSVTGSQLAFELAMAQYRDARQPALPDPLPAADAATPAAASAKSSQQPNVPGPDGLLPGGAYIQADRLETPGDNILIAYGHVEMRYNDRIIRAEKITYNSGTGVTTAEGHTQTIAADGSVSFSDKITYDDNQSSGISENFAAIGKDNSKIFARRVERVNDFTTRLTNIIYTPCELCQAHGVTREPSWSIQAGRITQRKDKKMVYYNNAMVKLSGVPVLYLPYMWTPDPELERASGFLQPKMGFARKRGGFTYEQPYLWSISPYTALVISPQINAGLNPLLNMELDRHFYSGMFHARFGFTNESIFDSDAKRIGATDARDYLLADGAFKISKNWRWSFTAQHIKDKYVDPAGTELDAANFFERYGIDDPFRQVGEWTADSRELINQFHLTRQTPTSYVSLSLANYQSLAVGSYIDQTTLAVTGTPSDNPLAVDSNVYPAIAPMLEAYWSPDAKLLGGQLTVSANGLILKHKLYTPLGAPAFFQQSGIAPSAYDTARLSVGASWYGNMTAKNGLRWGPFIDVRHDEYHQTQLTAAGLDASVSRDLGTAGFNLSYPLFRKFANMTAIIEPMAQLAVSPDAQTNPYLPTEDSLSVEFDDTTLFQVNKSPGFDIYESGARLNLGVRTQLKFKSGLQLEGLIGRVLRDKPETQFLKTVAFNGVSYTYDPSGLGRQNSDWVVNGSFDTGKGLYGYTRLRLDSDTMRLAQGEWGASAFSTRTMATVRYIFNDILPTPLFINGKLKRFGDNYRNLQLYGRHFFTKNWGVSTRLDRDLITEAWRRSTISVIYRNDCIWYELIYQRNETNLYAHNGKPQSSILFRLNLATLGSSGSDFNDVR